MTDSTDGARPHQVEIRNGRASEASAVTAAAWEAGKGGSISALSGERQGGTPPARSGAAESPPAPHPPERESRSSQPKRRRRRRKPGRNDGAAQGGGGGLPIGAASAAAEKSATGNVDGADGVPSVIRPDAAQSASGKQGKGKRKRRRGRDKPWTRALQGHPLPSDKRRGGDKAAEPGASGAAKNSGGERRPNDKGRPHRERAASTEELYAALDLGTNNCRLLIAQPTRPGQFRVVDAFSRIVRLGEGLAATGRLSDAAMKRSIEALKICAGKLSNRQLRLKRLIATEACRSAANGAEFLAEVLRETGLELEIVDRETEARLAVSGCSSLVERGTDGLVLFDIGGGSSEIAMIDLTENRSNRLSNHIRAWTSLPVGVVTLSERYGGGVVTRDIFEAMVDEVDRLLATFMPPAMPAFADRADAGRFHLLGTSGTVTTLAGLHLELPRYDRRKVDGVWLSKAEVDATLARLLSWNFDQRAANPCIGADRADLVLAGCAILESIRKRWPSERMRVADRGLREGLLNEMMAQDGAWRRSSRRHRARMRAAAQARSGQA